MTETTMPTSNPFPTRLFLVGPMGTGKTTIGRQLARKLKLGFYDSDRVIEERTGVDIPLIFEKEGEPGFRRREQAVIDELTGRDHIVLATGGGAILDAENRRLLRQRGTVIYLKSDLQTLVERTRKDRNRPLLHGDTPPEVVLQQLLEQREPLYLQTADLVIKTANNSIHHVIQAIIKRLETHCRQTAS